MRRTWVFGDLLSQLFERGAPLRGHDDTRSLTELCDALLKEDRAPIDPAQADTAAFYSISNCQKGLAGISFGNLLIKQVVAELSVLSPQIETFVTLSPTPGLNRWLEAQQTDPELGPAATASLAGRADEATGRALAARYLLNAKRADGSPADPVTRFHLGNGAEIYELHARADASPNGLGQSSGMMVNSLYDLRRTETNHGRFAAEGIMAASRSVQALATASINVKTEEITV